AGGVVNALDNQPGPVLWISAPGNAAGEIKMCFFHPADNAGFAPKPREPLGVAARLQRSSVKGRTADRGACSAGGENGRRLGAVIRERRPRDVALDTDNPCWPPRLPIVTRLQTANGAEFGLAANRDWGRHRARNAKQKIGIDPSYILALLPGGATVNTHIEAGPAWSHWDRRSLHRQVGGRCAVPEAGNSSDASQQCDSNPFHDETLRPVSDLIVTEMHIPFHKVGAK